MQHLPTWFPCGNCESGIMLNAHILSLSRMYSGARKSWLCPEVFVAFFNCGVGGLVVGEERGRSGGDVALLECGMSDSGNSSCLVMLQSICAGGTSKVIMKCACHHIVGVGGVRGVFGREWKDASDGRVLSSRAYGGSRPPAAHTKCGRSREAMQPACRFQLELLGVSS